MKRLSGTKAKKMLFLLLACLLSFSITFNSCKKNDITIDPVEREQAPKSSKFFSVKADTDPVVKRIVADIIKRNNSKEFVTGFAGKNGYPVWDKILANKIKLVNSSFTASNLNSTDTIILIPLVLEGQQRVNGFIKAVINDSIKMSYSLACDYKNYPFNSDEPGNSAENFATLIMTLDKLVFGYNKFTITDSLLFKSNDPLNVVLSVSFPDSQLQNVNGHQNLVVTEECTITTVYVSYECGSGLQSVIVPRGCGATIEYENCYITGIDWGNTSGGGGTTSGGSPTGGSGSGIPYLYPCVPNVPVVIPFSNNLLPEDPLPPCPAPWPGTGWVPAFDPNQMYLELDSHVNDIGARNIFKIRYHSMVLEYQFLPIDQYTNMSRDEFLNLLTNNPSIASSIDPITILVKIGINGAADVLTQIFFIKLTSHANISWGEAFGRIDWWQVTGTAITGLIPWNTTSGKFIVSAINGATSAISDLSQNGFQSWNNTGIKFAEGFCGSLIGNYLGDVVSKFGGINNFGKTLITRLDNYFPYKTICRWLGGGLQYITKSYSHTLATGQTITITANRIMKGWDPTKIAVIGRNMDERVIPFGNNLANELGIPIQNIQQWPGWSPNLTVSENRNWVKWMQDQGYTIYDIGLDPRYPPDNGPYYGMEILEIFGN